MSCCHIGFRMAEHLTDIDSLRHADSALHFRSLDEALDFNATGSLEEGLIR